MSNLITATDAQRLIVFDVAGSGSIPEQSHGNISFERKLTMRMPKVVNARFA